MSEPRLPDTFPGERYCKTMQASVDAILLPMGIRRTVVSTGTRFMNVDAWTGEKFASLLCEFWSKKPAAMPGSGEVLDFARVASRHRVPNPHIVVARMPARVSHRVALAIVGGGYHEAWHTKYSKRDEVRISEIDPVLDVAAKIVADGGQWDAKMRGLLLTLHHLIEDIRIERRGNEDFPGAIQPMRDLQDFILDLETKSREKGAQVKNITVAANARSVLLCCFRDLGLGYNTQTARDALQWYAETAPDAVAMVAKDGLLAPMLDEAKRLEADDKLGSLRVAARIVSTLWCASQGAGTEEDVARCPRCGACGEQITVRPVRDAAGVKVRGRAVMECKACGHRHEFDLPDVSLDLDQDRAEDEESESPSPEIDGIDADDVGAGFDGFGDDVREEARDARTAAELGDGPDEIVEEDLDMRSLPQGDDKDGENDEDADPAEDDADGTPVSETLDLGRDPDSRLAALVMDETEGDPLGNDDALEMACAEDEEREQGTVLAGEMMWCPADPSLDEARVVRSSKVEADSAAANRMLDEVRQEVAYLRARLRTIVLAQEMTDVSHGLRRGPRLSSRMLVDSHIDLASERSPARAYLDVDARTDISIALATCLDQSGSMCRDQRTVAQCMLLLCDAVESVKGKTMAFGFRDGTPGARRDEGYFHRADGVRYDVFKTWDETLATTKWRFAHTHADGSTPMADGVQYGLMALSERREAHRILTVITDGEPNPLHGRVIARQCRLAREGGVHVLGIGIGPGAKYVQRLFPDHVWVLKISDLPERLVAKLNVLCDFSGRFRGRRPRLDGTITRRVS